jgi:transposase
MSLQPRLIDEIPEETARVAKAAFPKGNVYLRLRDEIGTFFEDEQFRGLYAQRGQPGYSPWRLALICIMQFMEDLSDRAAAEAVRGRIDWKYLLGLELEDEGFDYSVLSEFRQRLIEGSVERMLLDQLLQVVKGKGLIKERSKQRTDSTHVVAAVRILNRLELIGETMRAALNDIATVAPDWLQRLAPIEWYERYESRIEEARLPGQRKERDAWIEAVAEDGIHLLTSIYQAESHRWLREVPAVQILRQVWLHQFYYRDNRWQLRSSADLAPSAIRFDSPYDPQVHYSTKRQMHWTGYKVHLSETCEKDAPHLITNVETTVATQPDVTMTPVIHQSLADKGCLPRTHLVDLGYVDADHLVDSQNQHHIHLFGPVRTDYQWQAQQQTGFASYDFQINWQAQTATCPRGATSTRWRPTLDNHGNDVIQVRFSKRDCRPCPVRSLCTRSQDASRLLSFRPQPQYLALQQTRQRQQTEQWQHQYAQRAGIEGTISQAVRGFGLRTCRYLGLAKTHFQHLCTAAAINFVRLDAWLAGKKRAVTRVSRFAALRPLPA